MAKRRVQAPEIRSAPPLRPAPIPGSTYVRPAVGQGPGTGLIRLADSLGSLAPSLSRFGTAMLAEQEATARAAAEGRMMGLTSEETARLYAEGKLEGMRDPYQQAAVRESAGRARAQLRQEQIQRAIATGEVDLLTTDVDVLFSKGAAEDVQGFGDDRFAIGGYTRGMGSFRDQLRAAQHKARSSDFDEQRQTAANVQIENTIHRLVGEGKSPQEVHQEVRKLYGVLGPGGALKLRHQDVDSQVLSVAERYAERYPEVAVELVTADRVGKEGQSLGALKNAPARQGEVQRILRIASRTLEERAVAGAKVEILGANVAALESAAGPLVLSDAPLPVSGEDGAPRIYSAEKQRAEAIDAFLAKSAQQARTRNEDYFRQTLPRELRTFRAAGIKHPQWEEILRAAPASLAPDTLQDPATAQRMENAFELYTQLRQGGQHYLRDLLPGETVAVYEAYWTARSTMGRPPQQALDLVFRSIISPTPNRDAELRDAFENVRIAVNGLTDTSWLPDPSIRNYSFARSTLIDAALMRVRLGMKAEDAVEAAKADVRNSHAVVNGFIVPHMGQMTPERFRENAEDLIAQVFRANHAYQPHVARSDIGVIPHGGGVYGLYVGQDPATPYITRGRPITFTLDDLAVLQRTRQETAKRNLVERPGAVADHRTDESRPSTNEMIEHFNRLRDLDEQHRRKQPRG